MYVYYCESFTNLVEKLTFASQDKRGSKASAWFLHMFEPFSFCQVQKTKTGMSLHKLLPQMNPLWTVAQNNSYGPSEILEQLR